MKQTSKEVVSQLFDNLWNDYSGVVPFASAYAGLIDRKGGKLVVDHLVFRTLNTHTGEQPGGIDAMRHLFENLGYLAGNKFVSADKLITVQCFLPKYHALPGILVGQLEVNHLPGRLQYLVNDIVKETPYLVSDKGIALMNTISLNNELPVEAARFLKADLKGYFCRPWQPPEISVLEEIMEFSPYCAWVLLFGNTVYRFSASVNQQNVSEWPDLKSTVEGLTQEGFSFEHILSLNEGLLQFSFTNPVKTNVEVVGSDGIELTLFDYSSLGLTERAVVNTSGNNVVFDGFVFGGGSHFSEIV